jgi:hypothetical protein
VCSGCRSPLFEKAVELLCTIPGVQRRTAEVIVAEVGVEMSVFRTAKELASWAGQCPGNDQSTGKRRSGKTARDRSGWTGRGGGRHGRCAHQRRLPRRPIPAAPTAARPRKRLGAVKHSIICAFWHMLATGDLYKDLGGDYFANATPNASPSASSPSSKPLDTPSRRRKQRQPERYFPVSCVHLSRLRASAASTVQAPLA